VRAEAVHRLSRKGHRSSGRQHRRRRRDFLIAARSCDIPPARPLPTSYIRTLLPNPWLQLPFPRPLVTLSTFASQLHYSAFLYRFLDLILIVHGVSTLTFIYSCNYYNLTRAAQKACPPP